MASRQATRRPQRHLGDYIGRLRIRRGLSQSDVIHRLYDRLGDNAPEDGKLSETWYKRIEQGRTVKVSRATIAALAEVLCTTLQEHANIWLAADRNIVLSDSAAPSTADEILNLAGHILSTDAKELLTSLLGDRRLATLNRQEVLVIIRDVIDIILQE